MRTYLPKHQKVELLYRGSRDCFSSIEFHNRCDNKGKTLTIYKTEYGNIFAICTDCQYNTEKDAGICLNGNTFILALKDSHFKKFSCVGGGKEEIYNSKDQLPTLRNGGTIYSDCNQRSDNWAYLNSNYYQCPSGFSGNNNNNYLGGADKFKVKEVEVLKLV